jgi:hypothetical protein
VKRAAFFSSPLSEILNLNPSIDVGLLILPARPFNILRVSDCLVDRFSGIPLHARRDVRVVIQRHADVRVTLPLLHDLGVNVLGDQERC